MTLLAPVIMPPLFLEDDDLSRPALLNDSRADHRTRDQRRAGRNLGALAQHQHLGELDGVAGLAREPFDGDQIVLGDLVLLAAGSDHCKHNIGRYGLPRRSASPQTR